MPAGTDFTAPEPFPANVTVNLRLAAKFARTEVAAEITVLHLPVPEQPPPDHPVNVEVAAGVAVKTTSVSGAKSALQVAPQLIPGGSDVTTPVPSPERLTVSVRSPTSGAPPAPAEFSPALPASFALPAVLPASPASPAAPPAGLPPEPALPPVLFPP